jgi:4-hydroxy-3-polyprenylbenzoate decarboxylase
LLSPSQGIHEHWKAARKRGEPLEVAIVVGAPPVITYAAASKVSMDVDELAVAGALAGEPIPVVRCKTSGILVPADAEIVLEGQISTEFLEPEGPFGEFECIPWRWPESWRSSASLIARTQSGPPLSQLARRKQRIRRLGSENVYLRHCAMQWASEREARGCWSAAFP